MNGSRCTCIVAIILLSSCGKEADPSRDIAEIKGNAKAYEEAYNSHNAEIIASFWASDALYNVPDTGESLKGRRAIADYFKELFNNSESGRPKITIVVDAVVMEGADRAIESGHITLNYPDGVEDLTAYQALNIRENGKWFLQSVQEVEIGKAQSNHQHLEGLDWLVGIWEDHHDNFDITLDFKWDKNNNFLIEHFVVNVLNRDEMEGMQIIGWDPMVKKIRSWGFDSDGGIREGTWSKEGDNWMAVISSTLREGKQASSIETYAKVDDRSFTFTMSGRDVDGQWLADIGPVTFTKKKSQ